MQKIAEVVICETVKEIDKVFHYLVPELLSGDISVGTRVIVPFGRGNRVQYAYVVGFCEQSEYDNLKTIKSIVDTEPIFDEGMLQLAQFMQNKYHTTLAACLKCIIPSGIGVGDTVSLSVNYVSINYNNLTECKLLELRQKPTAQGKIINLLIENERMTISDIKIALKISDSPIKTLIKNNILKTEKVEVLKDTVKIPSQKGSRPNLTQFQKEAVDFIINKKDNKPVLIHGVTGSGKTEIYLNIIEGVLNKGKEAIVLVPEISLTPQTVYVFLSRFGDQVSVTHSKLTARERYDQWKKAKSGKIQIIIGPRSAVFTPFKNLGIIIIDEEHENTYKSEVSPKYCTKEIAIKRGEISNSLVVLGSATPKIETYYEALNNKIDLITILERVNKSLPEINIVDMRVELESGNMSIFSSELSVAIEKTLERNEQVILFLNRRGHSTFVSCRKCGSVLKCSCCNVNYTYHIYNNKLICHYCGKTEINPTNCPTCGSRFIKYFGIGTQRVENEVKLRFPDATVLRMDMDTTSKKYSHEQILSKFRKGEAQILIGTQMIAKGLDFPKVSLVGIIAADISLNTGDYRSAETTFQLLSQVSGRAGRSTIKGKVFIQTYNPEHYSIVYAKENDYKKFYEHEISLRRQMIYPPFSKIFLILFTSESEKKIITMLFKLKDIMEHYNKNNQFEMLGPTPATISKIKNQFRWKMIVKCIDEDKLKNFVIFCIDKLRKFENVDDISINLTINPVLLA